MKKPYEEPVLVIELFEGPDIIAFSWGGGGGYEDDPIIINGGNGNNLDA